MILKFKKKVEKVEKVLNCYNTKLHVLNSSVHECVHEYEL